MGVSRSATVVWAYLVATTRMNVDEALDFLIQKRSIVCPNLGFRVQTETYAATICGKPIQSSRKAKVRAMGIITRHMPRQKENKLLGTDNEAAKKS